MRRALFTCLAGLFALIGPALAAPQGEASPPDAAAEAPADLDARTLEVARTLRCVVCKNQSIADSDAELARELRLLVRERIEEGDSNDEARQYVVDRYGEFVLLKPRFSFKNLLLWSGPFLVLLLGMAGALLFIRSGRKAAVPPAPLSEEERAELARLRGEDG